MRGFFCSGTRTRYLGARIAQHGAIAFPGHRFAWAIALSLLVLVFLVLLIIGAVRNPMSKSPYRWQELATPSGEVVALEFASIDKGWSSEVHPAPSNAGTSVRSKYRGATTHLKRTLDGGRTWTDLHVDTNRIERLRYDHHSGKLMGIMVAPEQDENSRRLRFALVLSEDEGVRWEERCEIPYGTEDFWFLDANRGYAWTLGKIFATWDGGAQWRQIAVMNSIDFSARIENIGPDGGIWFIRSKQVIGKNPWNHNSLTLPLPQGFEPSMLSASPSENLLVVLGRQHGEWRVLVWRDDRVVTLDHVPLEDGWAPQVFVYSGGILNLVSTDQSHLRRYRVQVRDREGWHLQSISGKRNFEQFAFHGASAWATRIALLAGRRELWFRAGEPTASASQSD